MNIRQIETFLAVAETSSFRRAAETLHRSQSVVSVHVQQLEDELGVSLLERTTRRVSVTPEGRTLLARCRIVLADLRAVAEELKEQSGLRRGRVSIGSAPSISTHRLPPLIARFQSQFPGISIELHEAFARGMYEDVIERVTDFAVGPRLGEFKDCKIEALVEDPIVAIVPASFPLHGRRTVSLDAVAAQPQLSMPKGTAIRAMIEDVFHSRGHVYSPGFEVMHQQTLFSLVAAGLGVTVLPQMSVPPEKSSAYQVAQLRDPEITREICLVTLKGKTLSPAARACADLIAKHLRLRRNR
jgi:LysR family transcriptional regulator, carnitine catabolism transcriptional activator